MRLINRRPFFLLWIVGVVALVASTAGAIALHSRNESGGGDKAEGVAAAYVFYGSVDVESGVTPLFPTQPGRVIEILVHENDKVKSGEALVRLDDRMAKHRLQEAKADLQASEAQLSQAQVLPEQHKLRLSQQQAAIDAMKSELEAAKIILERKKDAVAKGNLNKLEADAAAKLVEKLEAGVRAEEEKFRELKLVDPQVQLTRAKAEVEAKRARVEEAQIGLDECVLRAPTDGEILQIQAGVGSVIGIQGTQPAIQFCPDKPRIVRAEVEQEFTRHLQPGQRVIIQDEAGSQETWRGEVIRVSSWYTQRRAGQAETFRIGNSDIRTLECIIVLDKGASPFRLGQRVRAIVEKK